MKPVNCNPKIKLITFIKKTSSLLSVEIINDNVEAKAGMPKIKKNLDQSNALANFGYGNPNLNSSPLD